MQGKSGVEIDTGIDTIDICNTWLIPPSIDTGIDTGIDTSGIKTEPGVQTQKLTNLQANQVMKYLRES